MQFELIVDFIFSLALLLSVTYTILMTYISIKRIKGINRSAIKTVPSAKGISILKPLKGVDDDIEKNLRSFFELEYPDFEILFGVIDLQDPVINIVNKLINEYPDVNVKMIADRTQEGLNPKINNLQNIFSHVTKDYILISDSNTRVKPDYLSRIISEMNEPETGLVISVLRASGAQNWIAAMENLHINSYVTPNVFTVNKLFRRNITIGKSMLLSKEIMLKMGGFAIFSNYLAEDYMIAKTVEKMGYRTIFCDAYIDTINQEWTLGQFLNRHSRWAKMRKNISIKDYLMETLANPVAVSVVFALVSQEPYAFITSFFIMFFKILNDMIINIQLGAKTKPYYYLLTPLKDLLTGTFWYIPFFSRKINWRGNLFYIGQQTILTKYWGAV
ncbi:MAG: glycosyltransferase [Calditrichae bacterium]|nr:glycosyltransferase [Calditrichia bacterium]